MEDKEAIVMKFSFNFNLQNDINIPKDTSSSGHPVAMQPFLAVDLCSCNLQAVVAFD